MQTTLNRLAGRVSQTDFARLGLWVLFGTAVVLVAMFFGLLAVTANPIFVGMGAGLIIGLLLLLKPKLLLWMILLLGLASGAFVSMLGPQFSKITWVITILGFVLLAISLFNFIAAGKSKDQPAFVWFALAMLVFGLATTMLQWHSTGEVVAGIKRQYQAFGLIFAFVALALSTNEMKQLRKLFLVIALLQLPFALYEFIFLVALRGGLESGSESTDVVAGTFGANLEGGSPNSIMVVFLLIILGGLFARWKEKLLSTQLMVILGVPMVFVFFLGEVKVLFILAPVAFLVLLKRDIPRRPGFFLIMSLVGLLFIGLLGYLYVVFIIQRPLEHIISATLSYNVESRGYGTYYLNRLTVLEFWWQQQGWHDPLGFVVGHGLGASFADNSLIPGHIGKNWPNYGIGLTAASSLLWDTGVLGLFLFMLTLLAAWHTCNVLLRESRDGFVVADATAIQAAIALFFVFIFYNNNLVNLASMEVILASVLGYLAYLYRQHRLATV